MYSRPPYSDTALNVVAATLPCHIRLPPVISSWNRLVGVLLLSLSGAVTVSLVSVSFSFSFSASYLSKEAIFSDFFNIGSEARGLLDDHLCLANVMKRHDCLR